MTEKATRELAVSIGALIPALLVIVTTNSVADPLTPQAEPKTPAPTIERKAAPPGQIQWNQPLFEPKFELPNYAPADRQSGLESFAAPDWGKVLKQSKSTPPQELPHVVRPDGPGVSLNTPSGSFGNYIPGRVGTPAGAAAEAANSLTGR